MGLAGLCHRPHGEGCPAQNAGLCHRPFAEGCTAQNAGFASVAPPRRSTPGSPSSSRLAYHGVPGQPLGRGTLCVLASLPQPDLEVRSFRNAERQYPCARPSVLSPRAPRGDASMRSGPPRSNEPRSGVLLFNLGGPETLADVRPFLYNLFSDPDIIRIPWRALQKPLAWLIAIQRYKLSRGYYEKIVGGSPLRRITDEQARALEQALARRTIA